MLPAKTEPTRLERGTLSLHFQGGEPISAERLGALLAAMSREYAKFDPDGELVLVHAETGSLLLKWARRVAAAALLGMATVNTLADFAEHVGGVIEAGRHNVKALTGRRAGAKSAVEVLETAIASGSRFSLSYEAPDGERLIVEMDAQEAKGLRDRIQSEKTVRSPALPRNSIPPSVESLDRFEKLLVEQARMSGGALPHSDEALRELIAALVEVLRASGSDYTIDLLVQRLEARGLSQLAQLVREESGPQSPPTVRIGH